MRNPEFSRSSAKKTLLSGSVSWFEGAVDEDILRVGVYRRWSHYAWETRASSELEDWRFEEAGTCPELKN